MFVVGEVSSRSNAYLETGCVMSKLWIATPNAPNALACVETYSFAGFLYRRPFPVSLVYSASVELRSTLVSGRPPRLTLAFLDLLLLRSPCCGSPRPAFRISGFGVKTNSDDNPCVPSRGSFFPKMKRPRIWGTLFLISGISGYEKDAERNLEKLAPSFSPWRWICTHLVTKRFPV